MTCPDIDMYNESYFEFLDSGLKVSPCRALSNHSSGGLELVLL